MQPAKMFLHSISFKNFFSFKDEGQLNFVVNNNAPNTKDYVSVGKNRRVNKILAVYGANASGKTNALKSIAFMRWLIIDAYLENPEALIPVLPFWFVADKNKDILPIEGEVQFSINHNNQDNLYIYSFKLNRKQILFERLSQKNLHADRARPALLFERRWHAQKKHYEWKDNFKLGQDFIQEKGQRKNSSVLAIALRDNHQPSVSIAQFWQTVEHNTTFSGTANNEVVNIIQASEILYNDQNINEQFNQIVQKFDLGLSKIEIQQLIDEGNRKSYNLRGVHLINGQEHRLSFEFESSGTKKFFQVMPRVLKVLKQGGLLVLDEFDSYMHPAMSEAIVEMFKDSEYNPHDAQLVVSAHGATLLNLFDKYQIALVEKNEQGESYIWRLDQMKGVRLDENYYGKYLAGVYGGVPDIDI